VDRTVLVIAVGVCVYQLSFFAAVKLTGVAVGTVVAIGSGPAAAGVLGRIVNGERLTGRWALATLCAAAGVLLLAGDGGGTVDPAGVGLAIAAGIGYATCTVLSRRLIVAGAAPEGVMAAGFGGAAVLLVPVLAIAGPGFLATPGGLGLALYLGAIPTALAYVLFARGLRSLTSGETATIVLVEPVTAAALGVVVLGEQASVTAGIGAALVLAGLAVLAVPAARRRGPVVEPEPVVA
jgi:DME family drug/metabolite transporter